ILINIVTSSDGEFAGEDYSERILELENNTEVINSLSNDPENTVNVDKIESKIVGILHTVNDSVADAVYCEKLNVLYGQDFYMEEIMGLKFKVSAFSFFQTNIAAAERLYLDALKLVGIDRENSEKNHKHKDKIVYDLFCGTGTISQAIARVAKKVVGIEIIPEAVEAAKENVKINAIDNCFFVQGDVFDVLSNTTEKPDMIVVDPPRMGISSKALDKIISYDVEQILYISCNPKTLAENLYYLQYYRYDIKYLKAYDNFPNTKHSECIALLKKNN
ncbi:MAG: class I SAM-dependent RNA methyltransferase, partial [Anaerovoracaceae bacterium]